MSDEQQNKPGNESVDREEIERRQREADDYLAAEEKQKKSISRSQVEGYVDAGDYGLAMLYCALNPHIRINNLTGEVLVWRDPYLELDTGKEAHLAFENVANFLGEVDGNLGKEIGQAAQDGNNDTRKRLEAFRKKIHKKIDQVRTRRGQENVLFFAQFCEGGIGILGTDDEPLLFAAQNKVIQLNTGSARPGRIDDRITRVSPAKWEGEDAPMELWKRTLLEICNGDQELVDFLQRAFGYALLGQHLEDVLIVLAGMGRNGKSLIIEIIRWVVGSSAGPVPSELLLSQGKGRNSSGPSPDIMALKGLRMAIASETDQGQKISPSQVQWLTGGDTLVGRNPHDRYLQSFAPTHTLFLLTNHKPHAPADDFAFWERVLLVPFELSFVDREPQHPNERRQDKDLKRKLREEASGILAWLVRGCLEYQAQGLNPPAKVKQATADYRREEDILADWIEECAVVWDDPESHSTSATKLYEDFNEWMKESQGIKPWSSTAFGRAMSRKFDKKKTGGVFYYKGISLKA